MIRLLDSSEEPRAAARRLFICMIASFAAAWVSALALLPPALAFSRSLSRAAAVALLYVVVVVMIGSGMALRQLRSRDAGLQTNHTKTWRSFLSVLLWTVPAIALSVFGGLAGICAIGAFAAATARFLKLMSSFGPEVDAQSGRTFVLELAPDFAHARRSNPNLVCLTALICLAYIGIAAELSGNRISAVACTAVSWFLLAWLLDGRQKEERALRTNSYFRLLSHATIAVAITFLMLVASGRPSGFSSFGTRPSEQQNYDSINEQLQSGIILFKKKKLAVPLVLPRPDTLRNGPVRALSTRMRIPFSGEYWFSRWPLLRPPANSLREEGDPTTVSATLRGFGRLVMRARQNIERRLDVRCCHAINVVVQAADPQPEAVTIELLITDSSHRERNSQTLGERSLAMPANVLADLPIGMRNEAFQFEMPRHSAVRSFDSLEVWFHLNSPRVGQSAIVSIDSFELIP